MLSFQHLDVYQRAIEFLALIYDLADRLAEGHGDRADQLVRTAASVVRRIAEGAGPCLDVFKLHKLVAVRDTKAAIGSALRVRGGGRVAGAPFGWRTTRARPSRWFGSAFWGCRGPDGQNRVADRHGGEEHSDEKRAEI